MLNKRLGAAIAAACVVPAAGAMDTSINAYGDFRLSAGYYDSTEARNFDLDNNNSHFGLRVEGVEGEYTAFALYERLADNDDLHPNSAEYVRQFFGGIQSTTYGTLLFGRAATAYKLAGEKLDPFYNTGVSSLNGDNNKFVVTGGAGYGLSALTGDTPGSGFIQNQIAYRSPSLGGLTLNGALFLDESSEDNEQADFGAGAEYTLYGVNLGVQMLDISTGASGSSVPNFYNLGVTGPSGEIQAIRGYASFNSKQWGAGASYELLDMKNGLANQDYVFVAGWYGLSEKLRVAASAGMTESTPFEGASVSLGAAYELFENLSTYIAARHTDRKASEEPTTHVGDTQAYVIGVSYRFDLELL